MGFQTPQYKLSKLVEQVHSGEIQLPDFQRSYRWDDERIQSLLITVALGYPLGVIMTLQTGGEHVRFQPTPVEGTPPTAGAASPNLLLLDGQQRLTSFYQALSGDGVVHTADGLNRRYFIDIAKSLVEASVREEFVLSVPEDGVIRSNFGRTIDLDLSTVDKQRSSDFFPLNIIFDNAAVLKWLGEYPDKNLGFKFLTQIIQPMVEYAIPAIELDKSTTKGAVATVFEKVNTGGMSLTVFELLTAKFAGDADYHQRTGSDFRLKDDWKLSEDVIAKLPALSKFSNTDFLQAVTLLVTNAKPTKTTGNQDRILALELDEYLEWAPRVRSSLAWVAQFLDDEHIHTARDVPYQAQLVPLLVIRVLLGSSASIHGTRARLAQWFWNGVLGETYSGASETRSAKDVDEVPLWAKDPTGTVSAPATVSNASFAESRLLTLKSRTSAAYKGVYALVMKNNTQDWREQTSFDQTSYVAANVDIHHIFPQSWCRKNGKEKLHYDCIVNKTPLSANTNRIIGSAAPSKYLTKIATQAGLSSDQLDTIVSAHQIDPKLLRTDDFEGFFNARKESLLSLVEAAMGKPAQRDPETDLIGTQGSLRQMLRRS